MRIASITIYPVKGLRGISVDRSTVEPWGLAGDRRWMIVDRNGRFLSQREVPGLALVTATPHTGGIILSAPGFAELELAVPVDGPRINVGVWGDRVAAALAAEADAWLTTVLGQPGRLVFMQDPHRARTVDQAYGRPDDRVSFADGFPLLATNLASLRDLSARMNMPDLCMNRFRTNLVIEGASSWAEDGWAELRVGDAVFGVVKPCARCVVTTIDQATGERHAAGEPLRTLVSFRRNARGQPTFGQNLIPRRLGVIGVGDPVTAVLG